MRRSFWLGVLSWVTLATLAVVVPAPSHAQEPESRLESQMAAATARQARESERAQVARRRWKYERQRSAAHARMPDTMYASTPSAPAVDLSCPVVSDDDVRRALQDWGDEVSSAPWSSEDILNATAGGVLRAPPLSGVLGGFGSSGDAESAESAPHEAWSTAFATATGSNTTTHLVPMFPSASDATLQGFVRVVNHSAESGEVSVMAIDDTGVSYGPLTLSLEAGQTAPFNSGDLETGNAAKGLNGSTGAGQGDWRLALTSKLDIEVLSYIRTTDGFLTSMHDVAPVEEGIHRIAILNPGSNDRQVSRLRLINVGDTEAQVTVEGVDDSGLSPGGAVQVTVAAGAARTLTAAELESGGTDLTGALGNGTGKWRLRVTSEGSLHVMSLLKSPTGHLTNLSTAPSNEVDGVHAVSMFPSASDATLQGFVRVRNRGDSEAQVTVQAYDDTDWTYDPLTLTVAAGAVAPFNSDDLEQGNADKGLSGSTGAGEGDWRLTLSSESDIEVLAYIRTTDGFLTAMHDAAPVSGPQHRVAIFNPGSNDRQVSWLRMVNAGQEAAAVMITGIDDSGASPGSAVQVSVPAGAARAYTAAELESGDEGLEGALGDGVGKWRLEVASDQPIRVLSLLSSPTGHLTNLSTATARDSRMETAEEVFGTLISPIVQSKCINCHVEGGVSGNTRLVFVTDADADHLATNFSVFETLLDEVEDGADLILNKVQGVSHGGGIQLASGTEEFSNMERFLGLLEGEAVGPVAITPANLFDGVKMESWRSTLRRAAIVFAGRIPTEEEYASIRGASVAEFRAAIRNLMQGPEFHEFLIRASNDRLLTDRDFRVLDDDGDGFVNYPNAIHRLREREGIGASDLETAAARPLHRFVERAQYGFRRAPLELIAHVAENDLPYTEVLTANYIMANPWSAQAYGAATRFADGGDPHVFEPSEIASYYRPCEGLVVEETLFGDLVADPGPCATDYPHAGVLNTKVFLQRYPTTPTNRNRARSRWTYYHFLGLDIEKSASRTTNPTALADANNPTMHNASCTVCHSVLDPLAGAFRNYGDEGLYRDQWGGFDALDEFYKYEPSGRRDFRVSERSRQDAAVTLGTVRLLADSVNELGLKNVRTFEGERKLHLELGDVTVSELDGTVVNRFEIKDEAPEEACGHARDESYFLTDCASLLVVPLAVPADGDYTVQMEAWVLEEGEKATTLQVWIPGPFYREGDTWYRDMRPPGFDGEQAPSPDDNLQWLAKRIVADERFAEASVEFWWPAIMGSEVALPPGDERDVEFQGLLVASNAQSAEVARLANGFRRGFHGGAEFNLRDLLTEIILSKWFRAESMGDGDPVRTTALRQSGARRLLTPEELASKTSAITGFGWRRELGHDVPPGYERVDGLTEDYRLMYGGIDSGGITERARDVTSVMASVAKSLAAESSCPIVLKEFFLLQPSERRLFEGTDVAMSPAFEARQVYEIRAGSWAERETLSLRSRLGQGNNRVVVRSLNYFHEEATGAERHARLDRLVIRDAKSGVERLALELEQLDFGDQRCHRRERNAGSDQVDHILLWGDCSLSIPVDVPADGGYRLDLVVWGDQLGDELARLEILVESDTTASVGAMAVREKLAQLHDRLLGLEVGPSSAEVDQAYRLFVDVWERKRELSDSFFEPLVCEFNADHLYLEGILDDALVERENERGHRYYDWDWDSVNRFIHDEVAPKDPRGVARTWVVVLAFFLTDYRYLYL